MRLPTRYILLIMNRGDVSKSIEFKKLQLEIKKREWDVNLVDFGTAQDSEVNFINFN